MSETRSTDPAGAGRTFWGTRTAASAIFVAMAVALGYLLLVVPNVELVTFTVFASGVALGRWRGALVGALAMAIYSGLNPYGSGLGIPTMFAAQIAASALTGLAGGVAAPLWRRERPESSSAGGRGGSGLLALASGGLGFFVTALYQSAVIVGLAAASPEFRTGAIAVILSNAFFSILHLVSNTIVFAVLGPTVLPRVVKLASGRAAATMLVLLLAAVPAFADDGAESPEGAPDGSPNGAPADTSALVGRPPSVPRVEIVPVAVGGDVRRVLDKGAWSAPTAPRDLRSVGSGRRGQHASAARGVVPATLTEVTLRGRPAFDWIDGGLDLLSASSPASGVLLVPSGPDLSMWPARTSEWPLWRGGGTAPLAVDLRPVRRPGTIPFSRLSASMGSDGRSAFSVEFDRRFAGGAALTGFAENETGDSSFRDGGYDLERSGGSVLAFLDGGWTAELGGVRVAADRTRPVAGTTDSYTERDHVRSDYFARGVSGVLHIEFFHTQSWVESSGPSLETVRDGLFLSAGAIGPLDRALFELSRYAASGDLVAEADEAVGIRAEAARSFELGARTASVTAGLHALGGEVVPLAAASLVAMSTCGAAPSGWNVDASLWGRHPTAVERLLEARALPGGSGWSTIVGDESLAPEGAAALEAAWVRGDILSGVGARGQFVRVLDPIVLHEVEESLVRPVNADDENGASLSLWADVGDTTSLSGTFDAGLTLVEDEGALNRNAPVPLTSLRATVSFPVRLFDDYLRSRLAVEVEHESGLDRGPWSGLVDGSRVSLTLLATGEVGSARLFVLVENVLSSDAARVPGMGPGEPSFSAGFSWRFLD